MVNIHDEKFKTLYLETARQYVSALTRDLASLTLEPNNPNYISQIRISAHSLKGQSIAVGYTHIAAIAHLIEDVSRRFLDEQREILPLEVGAMQKCLSSLVVSFDSIKVHDRELDLTETEKELEGALRRS